MYSIILTAAIVGQCPNGMNCPAQFTPVANLVSRTREVVRQTVAAPTGCSGARFTPVRSLLASRHPIRNLFAFVQDHRPHLIQRTAAAVMSTGCSGVAVNRSVTRTYSRMPVGPAPVVVVPPPVAPEPESDFGGPIRNRIERAAVRRQLKVALQTGNLTADQKAAANKLLGNRDAYNAAVYRVHHDLVTSPKIAEQLKQHGNVGKIGDGTILQLILANLPAIMAAVMEILKAFGIG